MIKANKIFFSPWETIHESNPREILERKEKITRVPFLIMQGALDDNMLPAAQENFVKLYKAAGGQCEFHLFENSPHEWVAQEGPQDRRGAGDGEGIHRATVEGMSARPSPSSHRLY